MNTPLGMQRVGSSGSSCPEALENPPYIFLVSGTSSLPFKLSNVFPGSSGVLCLYPFKSFSQIFQATLLLFIVTIFAPTACASKFCFVIWLKLCICPAKGFPPYCLSFHPISLQTSCSTGRLVILSFLWAVELSPFGRGLAVPWVSTKLPLPS